MYNAALFRVAVVFVLFIVASPSRAFDEITMQFDGIATRKMPDEGNLQVFLKVSGEERPEHTWNVTAANLLLLDGSPSATRLFNNLDGYKLDTKTSTLPMDILGNGPGKYRLLLSNDDLSPSAASYWTFDIDNKVCTLSTIVGTEPYTFIGRIKKYVPPVSTGLVVSLKDILVGSGAVGFILILIFILRDRAIKREMHAQLLRSALGDDDETGDYADLSDSDRFFEPKQTTTKLAIALPTLIQVGLGVLAVLLTLVLVRVDSQWLMSAPRNAIFRPVSLLMDLPLQYWISVSVAAPWQIICFPAVLTSSFICLLYPIRIPQKPRSRQWIGLGIAVMALFLGILAHTPVLAFTGLASCLLVLCRSAGYYQKQHLLIFAACLTLLCVPLPESILGQLRNSINITVSGDTSKVLVVTETFLGVLLGTLTALGTIRNHRRIHPKITHTNYVLVAFVTCLAIIITTARWQSASQRKNAAWMPSPPLAAYGYRVTEQPVIQGYLNQIGNPAATMYAFTKPKNPIFILTIVSGAHVDAFHDPTVCVTQRDYQFTRIMPSRRNVQVRRMLFTSATNPKNRMIMDYWEQDKKGRIETNAKMGRIRNIPARIIKGLKQLEAESATVINRLHTECWNDASLSTAEREMDLLSQNIQQNLK